jgi:hypothetical protein
VPIIEINPPDQSKKKLRFRNVDIIMNPPRPGLLAVGRPVAGGYQQLNLSLPTV